MKFEQVITQVAVAAAVKRPEAKKVIAALFSEIRAAVESGEKIAIQGFGVFRQKVREAGERVGKDGKPRQVEAAKSIAFLERRAKPAAAGERPRKKKGERKRKAARAK